MLYLLSRVERWPVLQTYSISAANWNLLFAAARGWLKKSAAIMTYIALTYCLIVGAMMPNVAFAQTQADIDAAQRQAEIIQQHEQQRIQQDQEAARRRSERVNGMDTQPLVPKIGVPSIGAACRDIAEISINGAPHLSGSVRKQINREFSGRCLNVGDIERILTTITKDYIDRGFITTRAYLPPQDLSKGHLEILVIEGTVEKILIQDGNSKSISIRNVFPGIEGNVLNLRDLEQGIEQINRLVSNNAKLDIQPGAKPGESTVVVNNQPRSRFHLNVSLDNQGQNATGKQQAGITGSADNLLGFDENVSLTHRESTPGDPARKFSSSDSLNINIPFGYSTLSLGSSYSKYASTILLASGLTRVSSGNSKSDNVRLDRVVYRSQVTRASLAATLTTKESKNYLGGLYLDISSRNLTILDLDSTLNTALAGGVISVNLGYARGVSAMGALQDPDNLPDSAPHAQFSKFKYGFSYSRPFRVLNKNLNFTSQLTGQASNQVLYGTEQILIGGLYSVRGFVKNVLTGDDGYYWRNEVSLNQPMSIGSEIISSRLYVGYDTGAVRNSDPTIPQGRLAGMAVGISANWRGATWDFFNTRPLSLPSSMTKESSETWFRVAYVF